MLDVLDPCDQFNAYDYAQNTRKLIIDLYRATNTPPIVVGGSGLYFRALCGDRFSMLATDANIRQKLKQKESSWLYQKLMELDPVRASQIHAQDKFRLARAVEVCLLASGKGKNVTSMFEEQV